MTDANQLHLPDLSIKGFRGIDELSIPRLGRVTLLVGKNSVGKTTVLDAVRIYAARGHYPVLAEILEGREEVLVVTDEDGDNFIQPDLTALFHGRTAYPNARISIGPTNEADQLTIGATFLTDDQRSFQGSFFGDRLLDDGIPALKIGLHNIEIEQVIPWITPDDALGARSISRRARNQIMHRGASRLHDDDDLPPLIKCQSLGPGLLSNFELAHFWDSVALTDDENRAVQALGLIFGAEVDRVAVIGVDPRRSRNGGRRAVVKFKGQDRPIPLKSLGDGALRMFGVALALANSRDGFLLIDEAENGVHYSLQRDYWRMVLQAAHEHNVQVLATTHSWDCVTGFAQAATEFEEAEGILVRLSRQYGDLQAVTYSEKNLRAAAEQTIEVR